MPRATLEQIALEAQVSTATVNRVFAHASNVKESTRQKVIEAARRLGTEYILPIVGIVAPNTDNAFFGQLVTAIQTQLATRYLPLLLATDSDRAQNYDIRGPDIFRSMNAVGIVHLHADHHEPELLSELARIGLPMVVFGSAQTTGNADFVLVDSSPAMRAVVRHLADLGHRRFGFINGRPGATSSVERRAAFGRALDTVFEQRQDDAYTLTEFAGNYEFDDALEIGRTLPLRGRDRVTALIAANDEMAMGVLRGVTEQGGHVPRDISLVGYDNSRICDFASPKLASMGPSLLRLAGEANSALNARIEKSDPDAGKWPTPRTITIDAIYNEARAGESSVGPVAVRA